MRVLVLCGGESPERLVSLASGDAVGLWIHESDHEVVKYDPASPGEVCGVDKRMSPESIGLTPPSDLSGNRYDPRAVQGLLDVIRDYKPDLVFPILHGGRGEDGTLQALLEWLNLPFAGSDALASGMAMNKEIARRVMSASGVPITAGFIVAQERMHDVAWVSKSIEESVGYPAVIKPLHGGSTVGLTMARTADQINRALSAVADLRDVALVEAYFPGREIAATVVDHEAYPLVEIKPKSGHYDYSNKYTYGRSEYVCPAEVAIETTEAIQSCAVKAFTSLGCEGFARVDFLLNAGNEFVCLEVNTLPGMTANSLVPKAARAKGIEPPHLMKMIMDSALHRRRISH